jgi:hypothetical protein
MWEDSSHPTFTTQDSRTTTTHMKSRIATFTPFVKSGFLQTTTIQTTVLHASLTMTRLA